MNPRHAALAVLTTTIWGVNFVVIKVGLHEFPPLLFSSLRFLAAAVPALWFVGRPRVPWKWVVAVALALGVAKFGLLFLGMGAGMPAGLSSLVLQSQVFFTVIFAAALLRERPRPVQLVGMAVAALGIVLIAVDYGVTSPLSALVLVILGAVAWGLSNVATRYAKPPDALSFNVWVCAFAVLPLLGLSLVFEGPSAAITSLAGISWTGLGALLFIAWVSTLFGFSVWGFLLREYDAGTVVPFALLVPVAGMFSGWLFLDEAISPLRLGAAALVIAGMAAATLHRPVRRAPEPEPASVG
ncbi:O-acetylserine/cysteine efflux transporter [Saccharothrix tamanrassetensis]|uniref:O-acetylserine/cysteine efflux transporter n=1 Tax=Saccharothrix tamanrassetensis TaxID=1051531 RepID=A0A841CAP8_9PSEU|nr:EamA family transporter [Saccharothrix tamanrassetensis]MBB5955582.1 O-acetylserine/cysteine efflux transporter [Saccharothrix tamanrassetensis]